MHPPNGSDNLARLKMYFGEATGLLVLVEPHIEQHRFRFYFGEGDQTTPPNSWKHILELSSEEIVSSADDCIQRLESADWQRHLQANLGKIFLFADSKLLIVGDCP